MKRIITIIVLAIAALVTLSGCGRVKLEAYAAIINKECPMYLEEGYYIEGVSLNRNEKNMVLTVKNENQGINSLSGSVMDIVGGISSLFGNSYVNDQVVKILREDEEVQELLNVLKAEGFDLVIDLCGSNIKIDSFKM